MKLEDKYRGMTEEEKAEEQRKMEAWDEHYERLCGQSGGGMWDGDGPF